jgi:hypothetical protein
LTTAESPGNVAPFAIASSPTPRCPTCGENGVEVLTWEVDAVHDALGIVVEVEAGRSARSNAVYRDLIRTSLIVNVKFLALGVQLAYRHDADGRTVTVPSYAETKSLLDAIHASGRLQLPFEGVLLFGY